MWLLYNDYLIAYQSYVCLSLLAQNYVMSLMSRPTNEWETVPPSILLWATYHSISGVKHFLELLSCRISMHLYTFDVQKTIAISERIWFQYVVIMIEKRSKIMYSATIMLRFRCKWQHCEFRANITNLLKIHLLQILAISHNAKWLFTQCKFFIKWIFN